MPRDPSPYWDEKKAAWRSDCGHYGKTGRRRSVYCHEAGKGQKAEARRWFEEYIKRRDAEEAAAIENLTNPTIRQLCQWFLGHSRRENAERTYEQHRVILKQLCNTRHGDRPMKDFTATDMDGLVRDWKAKGMQPNTIRTRIGIISSAFGWASRPVDGRNPSKLLPENPLTKYAKPPSMRTAERYASRGEIALFLRYAWRRQNSGPVKRPIDRAAVLLLRVLVHTGARPIEICETRRGDLDIAQGTITLEKWKNSRKTGERRTIHLHRGILFALKRHVARSRMGSDDPLFSHRSGRWNTQKLDCRIAKWRRAAIKDGLPFEDAGPKALNPYMLRHTYISDALVKGFDAATIAKLCGTSVNQIERVYGHIIGSHLAEAAQKIARMRRGGQGRG